MRTTNWLLLFLLTASPLSAQSRVPRQALVAVPAHKTVRLRVHDRGIEGRVLRLGEDSVTVRTNSGPVTIPLSVVDKVWVKGNAAKTGAIAGGIAGGVSGAGLMYSFSGIGDSGNSGDAAFAGFLVLGGIGTAVGAGFGATVTKWRQVYP